MEQQPQMPPSANGINQQVKPHPSQTQHISPSVNGGVMDGLPPGSGQAFVQPAHPHVHYHHVDPNMQRKQVIPPQVITQTGTQMPSYYYPQQPYYAVPGQPYGMSPQSFPYAPYGYQYPYGAQTAYPPYPHQGHQPHTVPPIPNQPQVTQVVAKPATPSTTPKQKKKKSKPVNQSNAIFPSQSKSICPTDSFNVGRKNEILYLVEGFTMDRVLQNINVHIQSGNEVTISEKQVLKIDISSLEGKALKIQIYICQLNVDKIQDTTIPLHLFMEYPVNSEELEFQDLSFTYQPNLSNARSLYFLRFVLLETVDKVDKVVNFCDSCNFMIVSPSNKKKKSTSSQPTPTIQHNTTIPPATSTTPTLPSLPQNNVSSLTKPPSKGGEAPTVEFLKRLISTAPKKEHLSHWNNFMVTLDQLNVYDGNFLKKAEDISDSIKRGGRFSVYPCIEQCCPSFGPIRGGIQVSINVKDLDVYDEDDLSIFIDDIKISKKDITSIRPTKIEFYLPALKGSRIPGQVDVSISVDNGFECYSHVLYNSFEYVLDEEFEKRKGTIPMKERSATGLVQVVTIKPINGTAETNEEEYGDINEKMDIYNGESCQYSSCIHFERGYLDSSKLDPKQRFMWVLRRADSESLYGSQVANEDHAGVILRGEAILNKTKMADILEMCFEIDRRISSEKLGVAMSLQLFDRETKKYLYTSKALHILTRPPKPVQYSSFNEDERVLQLLDKIKTRKRRRGRNAIAFDPNLNSLGQPMTHALCLSDNEVEIQKSFQQFHLEVNDQFSRSPFHLAFAAGNLNAVKFFMEKIAVSPHIYLFQRDCYNQTPFHLAFKFYRTKFLVECCAFLKEKLDKSTNRNENSQNVDISPTVQQKQDKKRKTPSSSNETTKRTKVEVISSSDDEEETSLHLQDDE
ncbi:predicted protein [Naegleria gruberi]|uniref:Predicted protein n=1 Tax=Naegleria gruberi TaxID=5762 RepID=D2VIG8_NAEGR|nr:uncharacterized protein NAEGRDRAFT_68677 [Naegleria gruberi]EFC43266.1 predicted protein [Naegleria gruberi]|eukprot:XP_002676010.1 predicted protein [Naegleria gruberi strain NEG-M]